MWPIVHAKVCCFLQSRSSFDCSSSPIEISNRSDRRECLKLRWNKICEFIFSPAVIFPAFRLKEGCSFNVSMEQTKSLSCNVSFRKVCVMYKNSCWWIDAQWNTVPVKLARTEDIFILLENARHISSLKICFILKDEKNVVSWRKFKYTKNSSAEDWYQLQKFEKHFTRTTFSFCVAT